jgi:hypothetical protein
MVKSIKSEIDYLHKIFKRLQEKKLEKQKAISIFLLYLLNHNNDSLRLESLFLLTRSKPNSEKVYSILENLVISEKNTDLRKFSIQCINQNFIKKDLYLKKTLEMLTWALYHERNIECLIEIVRTIGNIKREDSRNILKTYLEKLITSDNNLYHKPEKYSRVINSILKSPNFDSFSQNDIKKIILNFIVISHLIQTFFYVHFELNENNGLIYELDLSDIEYEVRGWKSEFKNEIRHLSEITGLIYLQDLEILDLSNNLLENIEEIIHLKNLKRLILSKNRLKDFQNIIYLNKLPNLRFLSLEGNPLAGKLHQEDFNPNLMLKTRKVSYFQ